MINSVIKFFSVISPLLIFNPRQQKKNHRLLWQLPREHSLLFKLQDPVKGKQENVFKRERRRYYHGLLGLPSDGNLRMLPRCSKFSEEITEMASLNFWRTEPAGHWNKPLINILRSKSLLKTELTEISAAQDWSADKACMIQTRWELCLFLCTVFLKDG